METKAKNFIKNYFLQKLIDTRLFFVKEKGQLTSFFDRIKDVKKILVILPISKTEENLAREYLPQIQRVFKGAKLSTLELSTLRSSDTNWLGVPNQQYLSNIQNEAFDILIDLNGHHDRICAYLGALTQAPMRLHVCEGKFDKIYNLHFRIAADSPLSSRYQNLVSYINLMIQKPS
jgi:hypothetical protein